MSTLNQEYLASSNNSINDNKFNMQKLRSSKIHKLKQLIKPVLAMLKSKKNWQHKHHECCQQKDNTYRKSVDSEEELFYDSDYESDQNDQNEMLEQRIQFEIDQCIEGDAVPIYEGEQMSVVPVVRGQHYIPVHFAKTEAGTFFWTTMSTADSDICHYGDQHPITGCQLPEEQVPYCLDRWAQA